MQLIWTNLSRLQQDEEQAYIPDNQATPILGVQIKIII